MDIKSLLSKIKTETKSVAQDVGLLTKQPENVKCFEVAVNMNLDPGLIKVNLQKTCSREMNISYAANSMSKQNNMIANDIKRLIISKINKIIDIIDTENENDSYTIFNIIKKTIKTKKEEKIKLENEKKTKEEEKTKLEEEIQGKKIGVLTKLTPNILKSPAIKDLEVKQTEVKNIEKEVKNKEQKINILNNTINNILAGEETYYTNMLNNYREVYKDKFDILTIENFKGILPHNASQEQKFKLDSNFWKKVVTFLNHEVPIIEGTLRENIYSNMQPFINYNTKVNELVGLLQQYFSIKSLESLEVNSSAKIQAEQLFLEIKTILEKYGTSGFNEFKENINSLTIRIIDNIINYIKIPTETANSVVFKNDNLVNILIPKLEELKKYMPTESAKGGAPPKPFKKSKESIVISGKKHMIYLGPRSGKYIKKDNKYVSLSKFKKN
jgi:hypothetical protein